MTTVIMFCILLELTICSGLRVKIECVYVLGANEEDMQDFLNLKG